MNGRRRTDQAADPLIVRPWWDDQGRLGWRVWWRLTGEPAGGPWPDLDDACRHAGALHAATVSWGGRAPATAAAYARVRREVTNLEARTWEHPSITYISDGYQPSAG